MSRNINELMKIKHSLHYDKLRVRSTMNEVRIDDSSKSILLTNGKSVSNRNVSPQITKVKEINEIGANIKAVNQALVVLGFKSDEIHNILLNIVDSYNVKYIEDEKGNTTKFIPIRIVERIVEELTYDLECNNIHGKFPMDKIADMVMYTLYSMITSKLNYIERKVQNEYKKEVNKYIKIFKKHNTNNGKFYGWQQYDIVKEISEMTGFYMSFGECVNKLGIRYSWKSDEPYFGTYGKSWSSCRVAI